MISEPVPIRIDRLEFLSRSIKSNQGQSRAPTDLRSSNPCQSKSNPWQSMAIKGAHGLELKRMLLSVATTASMSR